MVEITELKDDVQQDINNKIDTNASLTEQFYQSSKTPYPSWAFSSLLLPTPLISKQKILQQSSGSILTKTKTIGPSTINSLGFGAIFALGGWIINEGDVESGSGFLTAWSSLYLLVNGTNSIKALGHGKIWPLLLTSVATGNLYINGKRFFYGTT
ncbi:hypothetical protein BN7_1572 [Wickerhamomyces ciferrii]|uniref:Uncharacterized protein n=1 Tax=Wickerhamomyces ciferrii (strain ATCC 14091 / BCRC 22168 / CBS 111 / JCM 3599 / NBRC 0793 / NRRL Y-1031 F-60-10) TaxID=1206466 RepID=K0KLN6_WICCF|nr:uncharacterized protein BN7_1572 [Wickerhamomyces ciferrii]CCH42033.1 hypothetical protein BN7_1572 [Wickerhamomyces ciferrii]